VKAPEKAVSAPTIDAESRTPYVLVVDDEPAVRRFAVRALGEAGFRVHEAVDGVEALDVIRGGTADLDNVLTDIVMPRLNGVQLLQSLALLRPDLPVILMSGYGTAQLAERGIASPCGVLIKPFSPDILVAEVRRCLPSLLS
jgi:CheY-like chemotaxis protein